MLDKIINYEQKVYEKIDRYEAFLKNVFTKVESILFKAIKVFKAAVFKIIDLFESYGRFMRYTTFPLHWIYLHLLVLRYREIEKIEDMPIFKVGTHYIYGLPGGGKSTLSYHASIEYAHHTGKTSYTTAMMELPRIDKRGRLYYLHQFIKPEEVFQNGQQIYSFNTKRFNMFLYEEILADGKHQRNNNQKSYNDIVLPLISSMATQRHQGIDLFYLISQLPRGDISIMHMLAGYHEPRIKKGFDYKHWLETGKFRIKIKGWRMTSYSVQPTSGNDYKLVDKKKWFYKCKYQEDMQYFNRLNMRSHYSKLPVHQGVAMQ